MTIRFRLTTAFTLVNLSFVVVTSAQHSAMPPGMTDEQHLAQLKKEAAMKQHGHIAMGFNQDKATHHFTLTSDGGTIAVMANDAADQSTCDQIRTDLVEIAQAFGKGDFQKPFITHGEMPPGVGVMQRLKAEITYTFEQTDRGGVVRITTSNATALKGAHEFLRYQITEHASVDPVTLQQ